MATVDPRQTLLELIRLQKIDNDVWRIERRIAEGPQLLARRSERLKQAEAKVASIHARSLDLRKRSGLLELDVKGREGEIAKIQGAQGQSRTNEEFRAFGDHIGRLKKENRAVEDQILELLGQVETLDAEQKSEQARLAELKKEADEQSAAWQKDDAEYRAELAALKARRAEFARTLPPGPLSIYERVLKAREGKAVVAAEAKNCGGCHMAITPNDWARMHRAGEMVTCRSCERILYLAELEQQLAAP